MGVGVGGRGNILTLSKHQAWFKALKIKNTKKLDTFKSMHSPGWCGSVD